MSREKEERREVVGFSVQVRARTRGHTETKDKSVVCSNYGRAGHEGELHLVEGEVVVFVPMQRTILEKSAMQELVRTKMHRLG